MGKLLALNDGSTISAGQWQDFWKKVELKKINSINFQEFLDNPDKFTD